MTRTRGRASMAFVVVALLGAVTFVQPGPAEAAAKAKGKAKATAKDDAETKKAKEFFKKGKLYFDSGQFDKALEEYTHAYEMKPLPGFLLNIAQCHRNLSRFEESIFFYKKYLSEVPDTPYRADVESVIAEMEAKVLEKRSDDSKRLEADKAVATAEAATAAKDRAALETRKAMASEEEAKARAAEEASRLASEREKKPFYQKVWFWGVVGGALLLAGGATVGGLYFFGGSLPDSTLGTVNCTAGPPSCSY